MNKAVIQEKPQILTRQSTYWNTFLIFQVLILAKFFGVQNATIHLPDFWMLLPFSASSSIEFFANACKNKNEKNEFLGGLSKISATGYVFEQRIEVTAKWTCRNGKYFNSILSNLPFKTSGQQTSNTCLPAVSRWRGNSIHATNVRSQFAGSPHKLATREKNSKIRVPTAS